MAKNKKPELLLPAGDLRKLEYAFAYGADAVYCGLPSFSLRAKTGFDMKSLDAGIKYAHSLKKRVYITVNIFAHNRQIKLLPDFLKKIKTLKPDAIIVSDPGVIMMVQKYAPKIPIHLSTQANTLNSEAVKFWQKQGITRIILGRETSLKDIEEIHAAVPKMELEIFVHGAMCMSYSGRCYLSSWLNKRSANEGLCTQPCRWEYKMYIEEPLRPGQMIPVDSDSRGTYIMNSKDLCLIDYIPQLVKAGVCSFKIEGRTKSIYYLATSAKAYRTVIDSVYYDSPKKRKAVIAVAREDLQKIDNRGYTTGFLIGNEEETRQEFSTSKANSDWQFIGEVMESKDGRLYVRAHNVLHAGEQVELVTPDNCYTIQIGKLYNKKGEEIFEAHGGTDEIISFESDVSKIPTRAILRKQK